MKRTIIIPLILAIILVGCATNKNAFERDFSEVQSPPEDGEAAVQKWEDYKKYAEACGGKCAEEAEIILVPEKVQVQYPRLDLEEMLAKQANGCIWKQPNARIFRDLGIVHLWQYLNEGGKERDLNGAKVSFQRSLKNDPTDKATNFYAAGTMAYLGKGWGKKKVRYLKRASREGYTDESLKTVINKSFPDTWKGLEDFILAEIPKIERLKKEAAKKVSKPAKKPTRRTEEDILRDIVREWE